MSEETAGEKTFAPTEKRLADAAKKGDVLRSKESGTAAVMLLGGAWLVFHFGQAPALCRMAVPEGRWRRRLGSSDPSRMGPGAPEPEEMVGGRDVELKLWPRSATIWVAG